jgi:hypothetical protein
MRDNRIRPARNRQFEKEFVAWVREKWPQPEMNVCLAAHEAKGADYRLDGAFRDLKALSLTSANGLVFKDQGHGYQWRPTLTKPTQNCKRCSAPGPKGRDNYIRIQDDREHERWFAAYLS